uniref:Small ribosomal subunit protein uS14c n=1 Tax=Mallomonas splendens TaxID=52552 RepID=A0A3G2QZJ8_9STRA|nr:ribosomal protein S14 [Mallomonas splendens]AYO28483.1 ribosomal protein S14 [Mallomonas splendens]
MAKKSMLQREVKRKKLIKKYLQKRTNILENLRTQTSLENIFLLNEKLQKLPRNSSPIRLRNRCWKTGKPRGYFRFFGLCRNALRELAHDCFLPGVTKSSW